MLFAAPAVTSAVVTDSQQAAYDRDKPELKLRDSLYLNKTLLCHALLARQLPLLVTRTARVQYRVCCTAAGGDVTEVDARQVWGDFRATIFI